MMKKEIPGFFKALILPKSSEKLLIPLAFATYMEEVLPEHAFLRNCDGKLWPIDIIKIENKFFFGNGWAIVIKDNFMAHGDFLTFDYDGDHIFDFTLYWGFRNGWIKKEIRSSNIIVEEEDEDADQENVEYKEVEEVPDKKILEIGAPRNKTRKGKCKKARKDKKSIGLLDLDDAKGKAAIKDKVECKRTRNVGDDVDVFEYGMVSRPNSPYFVAKIRETRKNELYVPNDVLKDHNIKLPQSIILLDEQGREWTTNVIVWDDGRTWLTRGWKAFCKWNNFKPEDRCICEFKQEKAKQFILEMQILRAGSWLPKKKSQKGLDH